ncbi:MAG: helix-turn-helix transcriptional regulator [Xanthobacteraceae bacterium]|nr:helix-turn-helix transcriptional regulator [Xanthobacteraceae bacterium]
MNPAVQRNILRASGLAEMKPPEPAVLSNVIGQIYDSAINAELWPAALEAASALFGGVFSYIALWTPTHREIRIPAHWSNNEEMVVRYKAMLPKMPFWNIISQYRMGELAYNRDMWRRSGITESEMLRTEFFETFATPYGLRDVLVGTVINDGINVGTICLHTPMTRDLIGPEDLAVMELLLPHLRRALTIGNLLDMKSIESAGLGSTLDVLNIAVLLVGEKGQVVHSNRIANRLLEDKNVITTSENSVVTHLPEVTSALKSAIERASNNEDKLGYGGIGIPLYAKNADAPAAIAHVFPLNSGSMRPAFYLGASAAVFVTRAEQTRQPATDVLAALFDLTPTEARVMLEISKGQNRSETAASLGIAPSTVKTHLTRVFEKTRTSKQHDLANLVLQLMPPILRS